MQVVKDKIVSIEYHLTDPAGVVLDSSRGREPLNYLHGAGNIIPGLESALTGKSVDDQLIVHIEPKLAYGEKNPAMVQAVPRAAFKGVDPITPGMQFQSQGPNGQVQVVTVLKVDDAEVTIDVNHPLAGVTLTFDVTIKAVRNATAEELEHGHVHGPGGHHH